MNHCNLQQNAAVWANEEMRGLISISDHQKGGLVVCPKPRRIGVHDNNSIRPLRLHLSHQAEDIKGRIDVLKKSQKEASILVQKSGRGKQTDINSQGNANKSSKLESELTGRWRSLFLSMEDIFVHESNQLQASYTALKDLRESCKMDLEQITRMPLDK